MPLIDCPECGGDGFVEDQCFEDTCCCLDGHDDVECALCQGTGYIGSEAMRSLHAEAQ